MTAMNYDSILAFVQTRKSKKADTGEKPVCLKGKNGTINVNGVLSEQQFRGIENYRRRIYDTWSVLRASNIIEKVGHKHYSYNSLILEGAPQGTTEGTSNNSSSSSGSGGIQDFDAKFRAIRRQVRSLKGDYG